MNTLEKINLCLVFLFLGLLLILLTIRSLSSQQNKPLLFGQFLLTVALAVTTRHPLLCLTAYACRTGKNTLLSLFLPSLLYGGVQAIFKEHTFPEVLFHMILLLFATLCLRYGSIDQKLLYRQKAKCPGSQYRCCQRNV